MGEFVHYRQWSLVQDCEYSAYLYNAIKQMYNFTFYFFMHYSLHILVQNSQKATSTAFIKAICWYTLAIKHIKCFENLLYVHLHVAFSRFP
jgi:hypothetical protein